MSPRETDMAAMYHCVCRKPDEGTATAAITVHAQACGFVAYAFDVHPDTVARAVRAEGRAPKWLWGLSQARS